jgi:plasmid stabilization system protein ParE
MAVKVRVAESAVADLEDLTSWYAEQGAGEVGVRLVAAILDRVERLAEHPDMGRVVPEFGQPALREIIHAPFRIVYRRDPNAVRVVRVWRGERLLRLADE